MKDSFSASGTSGKKRAPEQTATNQVSYVMMEMQGSSNPNPNPNSQESTETMIRNPNISSRSSHHRRAHSEANYRVRDDLDLVSDPFDASTMSFQEIGSEDNLFSTYMDVEKLASRIDDCQAGGKRAGDCRIDNAGDGEGLQGESGDGEKNMRPQHRHSNSVDGSSISTGDSLFGNIMEAKKAMAPDKLAELWAADPKRAKRILANRQSAARSKERKARYITELERKVQNLQTEATTLSAQLNLFQGDTTVLNIENTELKLRLQAMDQQAQLCDALNEALKEEVERLKMAVGEIVSPGEAFNLGVYHKPYSSTSYFSLTQQPGPGGHQNTPLLQFHPSQSMSMLATNPHSLSEMLQQDPLGRLQGLDINSRGSHLVKPEGPTISASESSNTF